MKADGSSAAGRLRVAIGAAVTLVGLVAAVNFLVNPKGLFPPELFEPLMLPARSAKMERLARYGEAPDSVVFGSSRAFSVSPGTVARYRGGAAFNASVEGGSPIDHVAFMRYMRARWGRLPRTVVLALSPDELFIPESVATVDPGNPLLQYWSDTASFRLWVQRYALLLEPELLWGSVKVLRRQAAGSSHATWFRFDPDGYGQVPRSFEDRAFLDALFRNELALRRDLFDHVRPIPEVQRRALTELLTLSRAARAHVYVYLPPTHPRLLAHWRSKPGFERAAAEEFGLLRSQRHDIALMVCDFRDPADLDRPAGEGLYDVVHPSKGLSDEILARLFEGRCAPGRLA
ncbi:MAG TPA: hypothetical protein VLD61_11555 [Methylomirabilota bacterium]|nr:hypothetical protein [Methylomirabilota bacterium]